MMKRTGISILLAGLLVSGSTLAAGRGPQMDRMHQRGAPPMAGQAIEHLTRAVKRLDLSEEQRTAIRGELGSLRESVRPMVQELHEGRQELHALITGTVYDEDAVEAIAEQQGQLTARITVMSSRAAASVLGHLNDEQRAELQALGEERRAHRAEHRDRIKQRRMEHRKEGSAETTGVGQS